MNLGFRGLWPVLTFLFTLGAAAQTLQLDFGAVGPETGYTAVGNTTIWSESLGYGWTSTSGLNLRDREAADDLLTDFIFKNTAGDNLFRISGLTPNGNYLLTVTCGDADYGDHVITVSVPSGTLATLSPQTSEYLKLSASVEADASGILDITFGSPTPNWVVNALTLEATTDTVSPSTESLSVSEWNPDVFATDPTLDLLNGFNGAGAVAFSDTGLTRADYLTLIAREIDYWKTQQNSSGAIIDPYTSSEIQYSTPAFANAAAVLVVYAGRTDLLEPAALAVDWAAYRLSINAGANGHDDFYPGMLANAYRLLSPLVDAARKAEWEGYLDYDPWSIYDYTPGSFNWTVVASCGDALLQLNGIRSTNNNYVSVCWGAQGRHFTSPYGLYMEGPMAYDHFPRLWWADTLAQGYDGPYAEEVSEAMDRAAITSLFMQSPWGELPAGGRSAQHQWNEGEQCVTFEVYAGKAKAEGDLLMAAAYKRAAHLSLASMQRWVRTSGDMTGAMNIVKNRVDPADRHGYESYSYNSQYNILPMAMLAIAYEHAASSEDIAEGPAPADTGGFVFAIDGLNKVFANAGGTYIEIETGADHHYDATGLIRIHQPEVPPQISSDTLLSSASYNSPDPAPDTIGYGVSWYADGAWRTLGTRGDDIDSVTVTPIAQSTAQVVFEVTYSGSGMPGTTAITEHYTVTPEGVELTTELEGYSGAMRYRWPVLSNDGQITSAISVSGDTVSVSQGSGAAATFTASGADSVNVGEDEYSNHNGWARIATAEFTTGGPVTLLISKEAPDVNVLSTTPTGETYDTTPTLEAVIEDNAVTVDPDEVMLLLDGSAVAPDRVFKNGTTTTIRYASAPLALGAHTAGVVIGSGMSTNTWTFSVEPLPPVRLGEITYVDATSGAAGNTLQRNGASWATFNRAVQCQFQRRQSVGRGNRLWQRLPRRTGLNRTGKGRRTAPSCVRRCPACRTEPTPFYAYFWVASGQGFTFGASLAANPSGSLPLYTVGSSEVEASSAACVFRSGDGGFGRPYAVSGVAGHGDRNECYGVYR